jgi:uridine kinase
VLLAGPSSSGKTTTCKRLSIQLLANGIKPLQISLDDYFVDREHTPKDDKGEYDYESIYALNLKLINEQFNALFRGEEIELPKYNFQTGRSEKSGKKLKMQPNNVLVVEGIHALNPELTAQIPEAAEVPRLCLGTDHHPARRPQLHPHDRQPLAAPHHPRL